MCSLIKAIINYYIVLRCTNNTPQNTLNSESYTKPAFSDEILNNHKSYAFIICENKNTDYVQ